MSESTGTARSGVAQAGALATIRASSLMVLLAAVISFITSAAWYIAFAEPLAELGSAAGGPDRRPPVGSMLFVLAEHLLLAVVLAVVAQKIGVTSWTGAVLLGLVAWVAFPAMITTSSVIWEDIPWQLAAIHAGDWLLKLVLIAVVVVVGRGRGARRVAQHVGTSA